MLKSINRKKITALFLAMLMLFALASSCVVPTGGEPGASESPSAESSPAPTFFYDAHKLPHGTIITWNPETKIPISIRGEFTDKVILSANDALDVLDSLDGIKEFWGIKNPHEELLVTNDKPSTITGDTNYSFKQVYQGLDVYGGGLYCRSTPMVK